MLTLFILWCLLRSASMADEMLEFYERKRIVERRNMECTL